MAEDKDIRVFDVSPASPPAKKSKTEASEPQGAQPKLENGNVHGLPRMLSPTLPASVEEQLARLRGGNAGGKSTKSAESKVTPTANGKPTPNVGVGGKGKGSAMNERRMDEKAKDAKGRNEKGTIGKGINGNAMNGKGRPPIKPPSFPLSSTSSSSRSDGHNGRAQNPTTAAASSSSTSKTAMTGVREDLGHGPKLNGKDPSSSEVSSRPSQKDQLHLVVRLKIPKNLRKNCLRILQMQPRPRKLPRQSQGTPSSAPRERSKERPASSDSTMRQVQRDKFINGDDDRGKSETVSKAKAVANGLGTPKTGEKRRQPDQDKESSQTSSKRQRLSGADLHKPSTPIASSLKSPNVPQPSSSQKTQLSTPKNHLKSAAMSRIGSTEGDVKTPLGSIRSSTPTAPGSAERSTNREGRSSSNVSAASTSAPTTKTDEGAFYKSEFTKYTEMAKSLKRGADALAKSDGGHINTDPVARREGLAIAVETTLCYTLAFALKDEWHRIKRLPSDRAAWVSLLPYFRFLKSLLRDESPYLQGFLYQLEAVCRHTILHHDLERLKREPTATDEDSATFRKQMAENGEMVMQCSIDGANLLTIKDFQQEYPETWSKRSDEPLGSRGKETLVPKRYGEGGYRLPLSNVSSSLEAVRAGWSFLGEWCKKEGVKWEGKMGL